MLERFERATLYRDPEHHDFVFDSGWISRKKNQERRYYGKSSREAKGERRNFHAKFVHVAGGDYDVADGISRYRYHDDGNARARARSYNTVPDMNRSSEVANVRDVEPRRDLELRICVSTSGYTGTRCARRHTARSHKDDALSGSPRFANLRRRRG